MKYLIFFSCLLFISANDVIPNGKTLNEIKGKITLADCPKSISLGLDYNSDGTEVMHSDDPLAKPDMNVIVSLHPLDFKPKLTPTKDAYISQSEQTFIPNVLPVVVGSKVHFLNEDEFFHNVKSYTRKSKFSIGRRAPGISYSVKIKKVGVIELNCEIHAHMNAKILSFDTPYFCRIDNEGNYSIKDVPDGRYRVELFHPNCSEIKKEVELTGGQLFDFDFSFIKPKKP